MSSTGDGLPHERTDPTSVQYVNDVNAMAGAMVIASDDGATQEPTVLLRIDAHPKGSSFSELRPDGDVERFNFMMLADYARALGNLLLETADRAERSGGRASGA